MKKAIAEAVEESPEDRKGRKQSSAVVQDEKLHSVGQPVVFIVIACDIIPRTPSLRGRVLHGDTRSGGKKHGDVVGRVPRGKAVFHRNAEMAADLKDGVPLSGQAACRTPRYWLLEN